MVGWRQTEILLPPPLSSSLSWKETDQNQQQQRRRRQMRRNVNAKLKQIMACGVFPFLLCKGKSLSSSWRDFAAEIVDTFNGNHDNNNKNSSTMILPPKRQSVIGGIHRWDRVVAGRIKSEQCYNNIRLRRAEYNNQSIN